MMNDLKPLLQIVEKIPVEFWPFIALFSFLIFATWWGKKRHLLCKLKAGQQIKRLKKIKKPEYQLTHLRSINPFVFEEMILTAIKAQGHSITRNKKYTGDGGIDGRCNINGIDYLVQAKRYKAHINPAHVEEFAQICRKQGKKGLFVHTGKTGAKSKTIAQKTKIEMISGQRLLNLLMNKPKNSPENLI